ncbi:DUF2927 domain-containing protein [Leptolyngbya sp. AN02str]|uniref:DUF2927 domain-containing protein n=1 Tax=Leptolyngbya sp. AN02str TaxID=3423363 RepID=UPI003D31B01D
MSKVQPQHPPHARRKITPFTLAKALLFAGLCYTVPAALAQPYVNRAPYSPTSNSYSAVTSITAQLTSRDPSSWINVRTTPSTQGIVAFVSYPGEQATVIRQTLGADSYTWYQLRFNRTGREGWVRGDLVQVFGRSPNTSPNPNVAASFPPAQAMPVAQPIQQTQPTPIFPAPSQPVAQPVENNGFRFPGSQLFSRLFGGRSEAPTATPEQIIDYFAEVALGSEFGGNSNIRKWESDLRIQYYGNPSQEDLNTLQSVIRELNDLMDLAGSSVRLSLVNSNPNVQIYFVPEANFRQYEPNYIPRNLGFFWARWNGNAIGSARILISTTGVTQRERSHLIREELTQSMGPMRDSYRYADSIFFQRWTDTTEYSGMDRAVITMLYRPEIRSGMNRATAIATLQQILPQLMAAQQ